MTGYPIEFSFDRALAMLDLDPAHGGLHLNELVELVTRQPPLRPQTPCLLWCAGRDPVVRPRLSLVRNYLLRQYPASHVALVVGGTSHGPAAGRCSEVRLADLSGLAFPGWACFLPAVLPSGGAGPVCPGAPRMTLEWEILDGLARGQSSAELADRLHYSRQAISYHLGRLMTRCGVRNRTALVAWAYEMRLLPWAGQRTERADRGTRGGAMRLSA